MKLAEKLLEQGEKRGLDKGRKAGSSAIVRRQLELKFGSLGPDALARLDAADEADLVRFGERVLTATSVADVLGN